MTLKVQLVIVSILIIVALLYFVSRYTQFDKEKNCNDDCPHCGLYNQCKSKKAKK